MSIYSKLAKNSIVFSIGNFASKFITLLMLPFYTSILSQQEFGQVDLIITTISLLIPLLTVNIVEAVVRFSLDKENYNYGQVLTNSTVFILVGFFSLVCLYPILMKINFIGDYLIIFYVLFLIQAIHTSVKQFARSIDLINVYMLSDILYSVIFVLSNILFLFFIKIGVLGYLLSMILAFGTDLLYLTIKTNAYKFLKVTYVDKVSVKLMFIYCLPLMPNSIMWWIINISDRYMITYFAGLGSAGLYATANRFPAMVTNLYSFFYKAWQVSAIEEYNSSNKNRFYTNIFNVFFFLMIIFASLFIAFNKMIIGIFVSDSFYEVWKYTPILVLGAVFSSLSGFLGANYQAAKKTVGVLYSSVAGGVINIFLNIILIPNFGVYGAAIATAISFLIMWIIRMIDTKRFVEINYPKYRMMFVFLLLGIQLSLGYLGLNLIKYSILNLIILTMIFIISVKFLKSPILQLMKLIVRKSKMNSFK